MSRYQLLYSPEVDRDLSMLSAYDGPIIRAAILLLADQGEVPTRNRRPLAAPVCWCPQATWQVRIRDYRVFYGVDAGTIRVLRVRLKGSSTTEEMGP